MIYLHILATGGNKVRIKLTGYFKIYLKKKKKTVAKEGLSMLKFCWISIVLYQYLEMELIII